MLIKPGYRWPGHKPGQYVRIGIDIDGVRHWRAYSLTSDSYREDGLISITPKRVDQGKVSPYLLEHHLFPDMPSTRYGEIAPKVREICQRCRLPYNSGPFHQQLGMVQRTIIRLAFPGGQHRPKSGAYEGPLVRGKGERAAVTVGD